jgi:hypothetical protein
LERTRYIRSERKETAQNCHQVHSVDTLLTGESRKDWQNMCSCKWLVILLLFLAVSVGQRHNYTPCQPQPGDILLHSEKVARTYTFLRHTSATVHIDVGDHIIVCVHALDGWDDDTGGYAEIVGGGIGYSYVDVTITSQFSRGFSFWIEVYGQIPQQCKYLRKCCVYFRTCSQTHAHHTCVYTTFYAKILSG